jgi:hypothetical protein
VSEFAQELREQVAAALADLRVARSAGDEEAAGAADRRLGFLVRVAREHGIEVAVPDEPDEPDVPDGVGQGGGR